MRQMTQYSAQNRGSFWLRKRNFFILTITLISIFLFSGCSLFGPKSAVDVMEKYKTNQENIENYNMNGIIDLNMSMNSNNKEDSMFNFDNFEIPLNFSLDMNVGKDSMAGDIQVSYSLFGMEAKSSVDTFLDMKNNIIFSKTEKNDWVKSTLDSNNLNMPFKEINPNDYEKFEFEKTNSGYKLSAKMADLNDSNFLKSILSYFNEDDIKDMKISDKGSITYNFDKDCNLTSIKINKIEVLNKSTQGTDSEESTITISSTIKFTKYNKLKTSDYEIPEKVIKNAKEDDLDIFNLGLNPENSENE